MVIDCERLFFELCGFPLRGGVVGGYAQDINAIETVQADLDLHIAAHAEVLEQLRAGIAMFGADGHHEFFNRGYSSLWRLDPEWLAGGPPLAEILEKIGRASCRERVCQYV